MSTLVYVRDGDLRKVQEFQAECIRRGHNFSYRNPTYFDKPELLVKLTLVDARYPHIAESYERRGVRAHLVDFKNITVFSIDDFLALLSNEKPGLPSGGSEGDADSPCGDSPQDGQKLPESPAPLPPDDFVVTESPSEISPPAVEGILTAPVPDLTSPRPSRRNVRRVPHLPIRE
jgi:hypothetical protein